MFFIRSDHGTEFKGELNVWCVANVVHRQYSAVYTPEQNGRAERANRDEIERASALLFQRDCPVKFWPSAMEEHTSRIGFTPPANLAPR